MYDQPAVKATMFDLDKHAHFLRTYREKRWDYDHGIDETEPISKLWLKHTKIEFSNNHLCHYAATHE